MKINAKGGDPSGQPGEIKKNKNGDLTSIGISRKQILFNLDLVNIDRLSNFLFITGLGVSFNAIDEAEQELYLQYTDQIDLGTDTEFTYDVALKMIEANQIYTLAGLLGLYASNERLKQLEELTPVTPSVETRTTGREMVTLAATLALVSFMLAAQGYQIIADGTLEQETETFPSV